MALVGRTCVVTGANSGIGKALVQRLVQQGANVVLACRDVKRAEETVNDLKKEQKEGRMVAKELDLASFRSVREFAEGMSGEPIHVLLHNAGVMMPHAVLTEDAMETTLQVNALSPLLLSILLRPNLEMAAKGGEKRNTRIVYVGSSLEKNGEIQSLLDGTMFQGDASFAPENNSWWRPNVKRTMATYANTKLVGTMCSYRLAREWDHLEGIGVYIVSPGVVNTNLNRFLPLWLRTLIAPLQYLILRSPSQGAETPFWAATCNDSLILQGNGQYFKDLKPHRSSETSRSTELQDEVWKCCMSALEAHLPQTSAQTKKKDAIF